MGSYETKADNLRGCDCTITEGEPLSKLELAAISNMFADTGQPPEVGSEVLSPRAYFLRVTE